MRPTREDLLWEVRVAFVGPAFDTDEGPLGSGDCVLTVHAADAVHARRAGLQAAREALGRSHPGPPLYWSVESVEPAETAREAEFELYEEDALPRAEALCELLEGLAEDDLWLWVRETSLGIVSERDDRFDLTIEYEEMEYRISSGLWHAHLADAGQAVALFQWLLTPFYRLALDREDGKVAATWVERYDGEAWETFHPILYRNPTDPTQWMGPWTREYWQQDARPLGVSYREVCPGAKLDRRGFPEGTVLGRREIPLDVSMAEVQGWLDAPNSFDPGTNDPPLGL